MTTRRKKKRTLGRRIRKRTQRARHLFVYALARLGALVFNLIPVDAGVRLGGWIGRIAYVVALPQRRQTIENLKYIYNDELSPRDIRRIARQVFVNAGHGIVEMMTVHRWSRERFQQRIQHIGPKTLPEYQQEHNAIMTVTAHYGSWELGTYYGNKVYGLKSVAIAREISNQYIERWLQKWRRGAGTDVLHRGQAGIGLFRRVRKGSILVMLVDQFIDGPGADLDFLGKPAHTFLGPATIAHRLNAKILAIFITRQANILNHTFEINELEVPDVGPDKDKQVLAIARAMNDAVSKQIRRDPTQWMWLHKRWRSPKRALKKRERQSRQTLLLQEKKKRMSENVRS